MHARLIHNKAFLQRLIFVEPEVALSDDRNPECIQYLRENHFPSIDSADLLNECKILPEQFIDDQKREYSVLYVVDSWKIVVELQPEEQPIFPNLKILTEAVFSIPPSNADPERQFSVVNEFKNKTSNGLQIASLNARCFITSSNGVYPGANALNFEPTAGHYVRFTKTMYDT
ncbi:hypothetical protein QAD02_003521 [Eretmocerus hayati]|uniref:Uncharacterized protein n=1 Tax=Eretmocerus hayati TaxID=131215 RepID=A0ACC2NMC9_9HYME|nr:hypothetical protein QAD02_003521 [Eretmocerus hayati]